MIIESNKDLMAYNTMKIDVKAFQFFECTDELQLHTLYKENLLNEHLVIGGGSNMILMQDYAGLVLYMNNKGISIVKEDKEHVWVEAKAGENWHQFVLFTLSNNYGGLENLSLIPGSIGASPIQNIGAYGVEVKDTFSHLKSFAVATGETVEFNHQACNFGYRDSIFKNEAKGKYIITSVVFKLTKQKHQLNINYGAIQQELKKANIDEPTIEDVSNAVVQIRKSKLPDPEEIPNCGSFFKNPIISVAKFNSIQLKYPNIPNFVISNSKIKVPAGWLIEQVGWKGKRLGKVGVHKDQALVLINPEGGTGKDILDLSKTIIKDVLNRFGIKLEREVNIIPNSYDDYI